MMEVRIPALVMNYCSDSIRPAKVAGNAGNAGSLGYPSVTMTTLKHKSLFALILTLFTRFYAAHARPASSIHPEL